MDKCKNHQNFRLPIIFPTNKKAPDYWDAKCFHMIKKLRIESKSKNQLSRLNCRMYWLSYIVNEETSPEKS